MRIIGLMSGTSADGVDAALVDWPDDRAIRPFQLLAWEEISFPRDLRARIHRLAAGEVPGHETLRELVGLDVLLADRFAEAARAVATAAAIDLGEVRAIASHGQTVAHHPELGGTLQIGCPSRLAERTGRPVVADFRPRDMAAGGEGAPLVPFFHHAVFHEEGENRAVLNLGGMANLTWLPARSERDAIVGFDVGPANALIDGVVTSLTDGAELMDTDGLRARRGRVDEDLLARLLDDEFLRRPPPKSTGRERYGSREADLLVSDWRRAARDADDLVATLVALTARSVALACQRWLTREAEPLDRMLVGGGGAANPAMMDALRRELPGVSVEPFDACGVPYRAAEAMAFSLMGRNALLGLPNHLPRCTGASRPLVLGVHVPGSSGRL